MNPSNAWQKKSHNLLNDYKIYKVYNDTWFHTQENRSADFYQMELKNWAVALAETTDGQWVTVRQFRFGSESSSLEFPAGVIDPGENVIESAARELLEETGYSATDPEIIGWIHPNPALTTNRCTFVRFRKATKTHEQNLDLNEHIEVELHPFQSLIDQARQSKIHHGMVHAALFFMQNKNA